MEKLTPRQEKFCREYIKDLNAKQAAIRAGYSEKSAEVQGSRLLSNAKVQKRVAELQKAAVERAEVEAADVIRTLANALDYDPRDVIEWGPGGFRIKDSKELTKKQAQLVHSVSESPSQWGWRRQVKLYDRLKAAELLGRHFALFTDNIALGGRDGGPIEVVEIQEVRRADPDKPSLEEISDREGK